MLPLPTAGDGSLSDEELLGNVKVFFLAGSDTTSVAITWCVYHLCMDPQLMSAVRAEVDSVLKQIGEDGAVQEMTGEDIVNAVAQNKLPLCKVGNMLPQPTPSYIVSHLTHARFISFSYHINSANTLLCYLVSHLIHLVFISLS